ncbi:MAG TPA: cupredoxin domain-containing protein [Acidimicrobiales bacterium]
MAATMAAGLMMSFAAIAPSVTAASASGAPAVVHVKIVNFMFAPMTIKAHPGELIQVTNKDTVAHTLTSTKPKQFTTGNIGHNQTKGFRAPKKPGTYHFICFIHQFMTGTLVVK